MQGFSPLRYGDSIVGERILDLPSVQVGFSPLRYGDSIVGQVRVCGDYSCALRSSFSPLLRYGDSIVGLELRCEPAESMTVSVPFAMGTAL